MSDHNQSTDKVIAPTEEEQENVVGGRAEPGGPRNKRSIEVDAGRLNRPMPAHPHPGDPPQAH
jgi:hypothetical protein